MSCDEAVPVEDASGQVIVGDQHEFVMSGEVFAAIGGGPGAMRSSITDKQLPFNPSLLDLDPFAEPALSRHLS